MKVKNIKPSPKDIQEIPFETRLIMQERLERKIAKDNYTHGIMGVDGKGIPRNPFLELLHE
ncbi:MAG TPA: hypothetical protein VNW29_04375 [Candidatus Sulfotelmatobacter sp.]|jgi:hypothetical protein|nr:hypothetical protein [Candidatus Sulfotelmatobacter sp.]